MRLSEWHYRPRHVNPRIQVKEENLEFILKVCSNDIKDYKIIEYRASSSASNSRNMLGAMVSDSYNDKYNIVLFYCKDSFPE